MSDAGIQAVPRRSRGAAIKFLVGGARNDRQTRDQADGLRQMMTRYGGPAVTLWWARSGRTTLAAAMVLEGAGRTSMLFCSPVDAPGVDRQWLVRLVGEISRHAIAGGVSLVQALVPPSDLDQLAVLAESGLGVLAELIYMQCDLLSHRTDDRDARGDLEWRSYRQFTETELGEVITLTYRDSLDCPALRGVREMPDIIAGHKCGGVFCPEAWWIVSQVGASAPGGCILVNDSVTAPVADVVYVGATPEFRGRGIATAMLLRAARQAGNRHCRAISLAVDSRNHAAVRVYERCGFSEVRRRMAYVLLKTEANKAMLK